MKKDIDEMKKLINEMREMTYKPSMTLESFILPEDIGTEDNYPKEVETFSDTEYSEEMPQQISQETQIEKQTDYSDIQKEIIQIRKIALSVITRLADNPSSESYDLMKKIWNMIDKVNDNKNELQKK